MITGPRRHSPVARALARNRLGVPAVLSFIMASVAPMTVAAGLLPSAFATTGLTGIPAAFLALAAVLAVFATGYVAMARHITSAGAFYAFISRGLGKTAGTAAALVALLAYGMMQPALYGALGPAMQSWSAAHLGVRAPWWAFALGAWAVVTVLGQARVDVTGKVLAVLLAAEVAVTLAETAGGLARPAGGHLTLAGLSPASLLTPGFGVLAVIAVLGFTGFEQAPVFSEEARAARRTVPAATYVSLGVIAVVYAGASWAMIAREGPGRVAAVAAVQGPGLLYGLAGSTALSQAAQVLFMTSLLAAALAFHNVVWRYMYALARERVLPAGLARVGASGIPRAASLTQSATALAVIAVYAAAGWDPVTRLFFWLGTTGGFGILCLLAATSVSVVAFFARDRRGEGAWQRAAAPATAALLLGVIIVLAVAHYAALLGVAPGDPAAWLLPTGFAAAAAAGAGWGLVLRSRSPAVWAGIGAGAVTVPPAMATGAAQAGAAS